MNTAIAGAVRGFSESHESWLHRNFLSVMGVAQIISWGTLYYSFPLIAQAMEGSLGITKTESYGAATMGLLASMFFAYPIGKMIDRGDGRRVMVCGSLLASLVLMIWSQLSAAWMLYPLLIVMGIAQSMTLYEAAFAVTAKRYPTNITNAITILTLWAGFASTVFVPLIQFFLNHTSWANTLAVLGVLNIGVAILYWKTIAESPARLAQKENARPELERNAVGVALRSRVFWGLFLAFVLYSLISTGISFHLYPFFIARDLSPSYAAGIIILLGPAQVFGRVVLWTISKRTSAADTGRIVLLGFPAALAVALYFDGSWPLILFMILYGVANGTMTVIRATAVSEMVTSGSYGAVNSLIHAPATLAKAVAPLAVAMLFEAGGNSYDAAFQILLLGTIPVIGGFWFASAARR